MSWYRDWGEGSMDGWMESGRLVPGDAGSEPVFRGVAWRGVARAAAARINAESLR